VYPDVKGVTDGAILMGCWTKRYTTAEDILQAQWSKSGIAENRAGELNNPGVKTSVSLFPGSAWDRGESMAWSGAEKRVSDRFVP
jgi:hypothetical protein